MRVVGRDLERQLTARRERRSEPLEQYAVVRDPVQRGVGEDEVELPEIEILDPGLDEPQARRLRGLREHRRGGIDADGLAG